MEKETGFKSFIAVVAVVFMLAIMIVCTSCVKKDEVVINEYMANMNVSSFEECVAAGNSIMESYPRQCRAKDGQLFVEDISGDVQAGDNNNLIGGQTDEHGCLGPAGYSWDEEAGACVRSWELDKKQKEVAKIAVDYVGWKKGLTVIKITSMRCQGCFVVLVEKGDRTRVKIKITDMKAIEVTTDDTAALANPSNAAEVVVKLSVEVLEQDAAVDKLLDAQVKWNTEKKEETKIGKSINFGEGLGEREVFEASQNVIDALKEMGYETNSFNATSGTPKYNVDRLRKNDVVCNIILTNQEGGVSLLEIRCADWK